MSLIFIKISGKDHIFKNDGRWVSEVPEGL